MARQKTPITKTEGNTAYLSPAALAAHINNKFGKNTLVCAKDAIGLVKPRLSTGSFALDIVMGGGFPVGAIELIEGEAGASKSWSMIRRAANFLNDYPEGVFILVNAEGTNDGPFLEMLGVDLERTWILSPNSGEEAWDAAHEVASKAKKVYVGIDSLDAMVPLAELEDDMDASKMAPAARMNNKGFRKLISVMRSDITTQDHRVSVGVIAQLRTNIGVMFGDPSTSVGGKGKIYAATTRIRLKRIKALRTEGEKVADRVTYGLLIEAEVIKNKGVGEGEAVRYTLYKENYEGFKRGEIDNVTELVPFLLRYKIVTKAGAWYKLPDGRAFQGDAGLSAALRDDDTLRAELIDQVKSAVNERHRITAAVKKLPSKSPLKKAMKRRGK